MHPPASASPSPGTRARRAPLLDLDVLAGLEAEVEGSGFRFAAAFIGMWEQRYTRIWTALHDGRRDDALEAVLSLKVSSSMVGAHRLAAEAASLERALRSGDTASDPGRIRRCGRRTMASIRRRYLRAGPAACTAAATVRQDVRRSP